ncbi:MAG: hypothetical protein ABFS32_03335, partial [Bacteroidota bacterium]
QNHLAMVSFYCRFCKLKQAWLPNIKNRLATLILFREPYNQNHLAMVSFYCRFCKLKQAWLPFAPIKNH